MEKEHGFVELARPHDVFRLVRAVEHVGPFERGVAELELEIAELGAIRRDAGRGNVRENVRIIP